MDSIRKKVQTQNDVSLGAAPRLIKKPLIVKKKEEIFITRSESEKMDRQHKTIIRKHEFSKKIMYSAITALIFIFFCIAVFFLWKTFTISKKMNSNADTPTTLTQNARALVAPITLSNKPLKGEENGRINILLLGAAGEHKPGGNLTDTVMIMNIDTKNKKVALLSLPRDLYVSIPSIQKNDPSNTSNKDWSIKSDSNSKSHTKINSLYPIGVKEGVGADLIKSAVEKITGEPLNYYIVVDFDAFQKIVDTIGGINITSERDIYDATYPGPNYSYETFSLSKGFHNLDGATALKYVRERHNDPEGDFGRAKRQQQVIQAVKNKIFSLQTFFNVVTLNNILNVLGNNIKTDIAFDDIEKFIALSKTLDLQNMDNKVVDAWKSDSILKVSHVQLGSANAFVLVPRVGNYSEIQDLAKNIFDLSEINKRSEEITSENAKIAIINNSGEVEMGNKIKSLLTEKLKIRDVDLIPKKDDEITEFTTVTEVSSQQKIFTLDELIKKLPAKISTQDFSVINNDSYDIVITLGSDLAETYKYEDANIEDFKKEQDKQDADVMQES